MPPIAHKITIDLLLDEQGTFKILGVGSSLDLKPAQLGLIFLAMIQEVLRGEVEQKPRPLVEIPEMFNMPVPSRSM